MGQLADDMVEGRSCSSCGIYFVKSHGFPVVCKTCHEPNSDIPKATIKEI